MNRFDQLLTSYLAGTLRPSEVTEFLGLLEAHEAAVHDSIDEQLTADPEGFSLAGEKELIYTAVSKRIQKQATYPPVHRVHFLKTAWFRYAAAIILFIGIGMAGYFVAVRNDHNDIVQNEKPTITAPAENILPGSNKALLTLSDGRKITLDSATAATITDQNLSIENNNGQLKYGSSELVAYNTMTTPRGGQYQVVLPDGTKVWLNAASSITYPTAFTGKAREVSISGEAYFEVKTNKEKPFIVSTPQEKITVLGTSFNVNVYTDEPLSKTTLISGAIKVGEQLLKPGQALVNHRTVETNINQDIAWKNGLMNFDDMDVQTAMRQISRWYNVDVIYAGEIPKKQMGGELGRDLTLSQVLRSLDDIGVKTTLENNTITVLSNDKN